MPVNPLPNWESTLLALPKVADDSWAKNFSDWVFDQSSGLSPDPSSLVSAGFSFSFNTSTFEALLEVLKPVSSAEEGITNFADALASALTSSSVAAPPGSFIPPTSPVTLFSIVSTTVLDPASITAARAKVLELIPLPPTSKTRFPEKFREAFLSLTITVIGTNSATPTASPLTAASVPLI